ncbi:MAG: NAD(P)-dependent oxidoreductase [Syntrophales bacterium]|jgi:3-hydroxyisobutyrate dehydrogenase-like beta-hydroxyacid dehydrogenase|nr:NAD(P)-dependent oxidoreductase [Syntrophales bacterium]
MKPKIGFIGLGAMGRGMALNILRKGFPLRVFDVDKQAVQRLVEAGATAAADLQAVAEYADWIILSLPDTEVVRTVLWGEAGLASRLSGGQIVIDCGTTHPLATMDFQKRLAESKIDFVDAPVSGMEQRALEGMLTTMAGGSRDIFDKVKPVLESFSKNVEYMGSAGCGQLAKVINNVFFNISCAAVAELLPLAVKMGLDAEKIVEVAGSGTGQSFALNFFGPLILKRDFGQGYPMKKAYKDMSSIMEIMNANKIPIPVTQAALTTYQLALNQGLGDESKGAMVKVWEEVLNVEVRQSR